MKIHNLVGIIITGVLVTSAVQAATLPTTEEIYSGMSATEIQKNQLANPAAERVSTAVKTTCALPQAESETVDQLHAAYPGSEEKFGEKDYLATSNQDLVC